MLSTPTYHGNASWLEHAWDTPTEIVERFREACDRHKYVPGRDFDTLVGTGLSGALIVPTLAKAYGLHWAIVRKDSDKRVSGFGIEGSIGQRWIFVDDLVDSGATRSHVLSVVEEKTTGSENVGQYLYCETEWVGEHVGDRVEGRIFVERAPEPPLDVAPIYTSFSPGVREAERYQRGQ